MIKIVKQGKYILIETKQQIKILTLDGKITYAWINAKGIGEILVTSHKKHKTDCILAMGRYMLYKVKKEPNLTDLIHLELEVGEGCWQGYLLLSGLPDDKKTKGRIIPADELISINLDRGKLCGIDED